MINWLFSFISILGVNKNFTHYKLLTKKKKNDVAVDVAQRESSSIKRYASTFSNLKVM